jgi:hypothetical protein
MLDYAVDSIKKFEDLLGKLHDQYSQNSASVSVEGLGSAYGAYLGEVIVGSGQGVTPLARKPDPISLRQPHPCTLSAFL